MLAYMLYVSNYPTLVRVFGDALAQSNQRLRQLLQALLADPFMQSCDVLTVKVRGLLALSHAHLSLLIHTHNGATFRNPRASRCSFCNQSTFSRTRSLLVFETLLPRIRARSAKSSIARFSCHRLRLRYDDACLLTLHLRASRSSKLHVFRRWWPMHSRRVHSPSTWP